MTHLKNLIQTAPIPGSDGWHTAVIEVTPTMADGLLANNSGNRRLSPGAVARYAAAMRRGDWKASPEPLIFAPSGRLMNGQTRLNAVKATGLPQTFFCVFGVDESVFSVLDRGRPRSFADAHGVPVSLAEVARLTAQITVSDSKGIVTDSDFLRMAHLLRDTHADLESECGTRRRLFSNAAFRAAACARVLTGESSTFVFGLYRALVLSEIDHMPPAGHAAIRAALNGTWQSGGRVAQFENVARAWGLFWEAGADRTKLPIKNVEAGLAEFRKGVTLALRDSEVD